jgi:hypothetical protein
LLVEALNHGASARIPKGLILGMREGIHHGVGNAVHIEEAAQDAVTTVW